MSSCQQLGLCIWKKKEEKERLSLDSQWRSGISIMGETGNGKRPEELQDSEEATGNG